MIQYDEKAWRNMLKWYVSREVVEDMVKTEESKARGRRLRVQGIRRNRLITVYFYRSGEDLLIDNVHVTTGRTAMRRFWRSE